MLGRLVALIDDLSTTDGGDDGERAVELAAAMLMVEVGLADHDFSDEEAASIHDILMTDLGLTAGQATDLLESARREVEQSVGVQAFTRQLNERFSVDERVRLVRHLWRIAVADGHVDDHEEHRIRRIADLLYVPHVKFVRARHDAMTGRPRG